MESIVTGTPPVGRADGHVDLTGKATARPLGGIIQGVTVRRADDEDIQVSRRTAFLPGVAGSPGSE
jgi:hypothetical protein